MSQPGYTSISALFNAAAANRPVFEYNAEIALEAAKRQLGPDIEARFEMGGLKSLERAQAKVQSDYKGDHNRITDIVRGRFVVGSVEALEVIQQAIAERFEIVETKDRFNKPNSTEFRDRNIRVRLPSGHVAEIQVHHSAMMTANATTHDAYEMVQAIERQAVNRALTSDEQDRRDDYRDMCRLIHNHAAEAAGLNTLLAAGRKAPVLPPASALITRLLQDHRYPVTLTYKGREDTLAAHIDNKNTGHDFLNEMSGRITEPYQPLFDALRRIHETQSKAELSANNDKRAIPAHKTGALAAGIPTSTSSPASPQ